MFKLIIFLFILMFSAEAKEPTDAMKEFMRGELKEVLAEYKYQGEDAKLINLYLEDKYIIYEMKADYKKYVNKNSLSTKFGENPVASHKKIRRVNSMFTAMTLRQELRRNMCSDAQIMSVLRDGFVYKFEYTWDDEKIPFLIKKIDEQECTKFFNKDK